MSAGRVVLRRHLRDQIGTTWFEPTGVKGHALRETDAVAAMINGKQSDVAGARPRADD
jgi:hypothetical protein